MEVKLKYEDGFEVELEVSEEILDAGVVMVNKTAFVYKSSSRFSQPVFVEQKVYYA